MPVVIASSASNGSKLEYATYICMHRTCGYDLLAQQETLQLPINYVNMSLQRFYVASFGKQTFDSHL